MTFLLEAACTGGIHGVQAADAGDGGATEPAEPSDPAEETNRRIFGFNLTVDHAVTKPVATAYKVDVPVEMQHGVHNFVTNLSEPSVLINDVLQGNLKRAVNTTGRFLLNTTVGVAGLFDAAATLGMPHHPADFGQTFGVWGLQPGPAVQLPLMGSSNVRDSVGSVLGIVFNPLSVLPGGAAIAVTTANAGAGAVDGRASVLAASDDLEKHSLDYYATLRSVAAQRRAALVEDGRAGLVQPAMATAE
jgi:phospholipid-binding lipoprotein MlaA